MLLNIVTLTGEEHIVDVRPTDRVLSIKHIMEEKSGTPLEQQRLMFQGKKLRDEDTIDRCRLPTGAVLHLIVALRGGEEWCDFLHNEEPIIMHSIM